MRPRIALVVVCLGLLCLAVLISLRRTSGLSRPQSSPGAPVAQPPPPASAALALTNYSRPETEASQATPSEPPAEDSPAARQEAYALNRINELLDLSTHDDRDSLNVILSELTNRDPRIRQAALEAATQFGSRDAIPSLEDAITQIDDVQEKAALAKAIEFLRAPTLAEAAAQKKEEAAATNGAH